MLIKPRSALRKSYLATTLPLIGIILTGQIALTSVAYAEQSQTIEIIRDTYGVPHIFADTTYGLFYGYGHAIAQDRLYQLEMTRRSTQGRVAEVLGKEYLKFDIGIRQHYSPESIRLQMADLPQQDLDILKGYADGINHWLQSIKADPENLMPKQFIDQGFEPQPWSSFDVAMVFIGSMINRFGDYNTELQNQQLLDKLAEQHGEADGLALFNTLVAFYDADAPTTIAKGEWDSGLRSDAFADLSIDKAPINTDSSQLLAALGGTLQLPNVQEHAFSNVFLLSGDRSRDASAILVNGPQFGFYQPAYTYSVGLHGAGFNVVGNSPFGYPMVQFGYNEHITWGSTWAATDNVDIFQLQLNPDNPVEYLHQGEYRPMQRKLETIHVKDADSHDLVIYRSHYGAIVDYRPEEHIAYAKSRGWDGEEINTLMAWSKVAKASNHEQWLDHVQHSAINVNWYYADAEGNIGYVMGGRYPKRASGHDGRTPVAGTGEYDWRGFMPFETNPQILNPSSGYIANWNQRPAEGVPNPDMWWYAWHEADRIAPLSSRLEAQEQLTAEEAWDLMMEVSFEDPNARFYVPRLIQALDAAEQPSLQQARDLLASWNYLDLDEDRNGYYDHPATAIFRHWQHQLIELVLKDQLPEAFSPWFISTGHPQPGQGSSSHNLSVAGKVIHQMLVKHEQGQPLDFDLLQGRDPGDLMREAMERALTQLNESQGSDMANWHHPISHTVYSHKNFLQIPQAGEDEVMRNHLAMNRGTENNMTVFTADGVRGYEVAGPGQSGFIAPDGTRSPHYDDQLELFGDLGKKRTWLSRADIEQAAKSRILLELN